MGCVKKVAPWVVDPLGMLIHQTTGFGYTPGGMVNQILNPPPRPTAATREVTPTPALPKPPPPPPPWHPATNTGATPGAQHVGSPTSDSSDRTRGLIRGGMKRGGGGSSLLT